MKDAYGILNQISADMVLDAATGKGDFINILKQNLKSFTQIIGVDASERAVDYAQKLFPENNVEIYRMDLEKLQFDDAHFDLVCLANALHHMEKLDLVLAELLRVLKSGGRFLIVEMYRDGEQSEAQKTHILLHHWLAAIDTSFGVYHSKTFTRHEIEAIVQKLKLKKMQWSDFYIPVDNPKDGRSCEGLKRNCLENIKRLESLEGTEKLIDEGKAIMERITNVGCASPSRMMCVGVKV